jgi:threonine synthase
MKGAEKNQIRIRCFSCELEHDANILQSVCTACGDPLRVDYDLPSIRLSRADVRDRAPSLWR